VNGVTSLANAQLMATDASSTNGPLNTYGPGGSGL
jgi:hypothetical protein